MSDSLQGPTFTSDLLKLAGVAPFTGRLLIPLLTTTPDDFGSPLVTGRPVAEQEEGTSKVAALYVRYH